MKRASPVMPERVCVCDPIFGSGTVALPPSQADPHPCGMVEGCEPAQWTGRRFEACDGGWEWPGYPNPCTVEE